MASLAIARYALHPATVYLVLTLLVIGPLLMPGYILTLDMVFGPRIPLPNEITYGYIFKAGLHALSWILPTQLIQKMLLLGSLWLAGVGTHRLFIDLRPENKSLPWGAYAAGALYMINPYTYARFMTGQYTVLLSYALLPFFVHAFLKFLQRPHISVIARVCCWSLLISIISLQMLVLCGVFAAIATSVSLLQQRSRSYAKQLLRSGCFGLIVVLLASSYWLIPLVQGNGDTAAAIRQFSTYDQHAFATAGENLFTRAVNAVRLQGQWSDTRGLYRLPQDTIPVWGLSVMLLLGVVVNGGRSFWQQGQRHLMLIFSLSAGAALIIATTGILQVLPVMQNWREPHKIIGLLALVYALFFGQGIQALLMRARQHGQDFAYAAILGGSGVLLALYTPVMLWGFGGQLRPRQYPPDWYSINTFLNQDKTYFKTLFLPWHLYMPFDFSERTIAHPAPVFFDKPVLISNDPEYQNTVASSSGTQTEDAASAITQAPLHQKLGEKLAPLQVKYIVLIKDEEYSKYSYLERQIDLQLIQETDTLKLYRNRAWREK